MSEITAPAPTASPGFAVPTLRRRIPWVDLLVAVVVLAVAIAVPFFVTQRYYLGELALMFTLMIIASQWNLLYGVAGVFSLGQMLLYATGGYVVAILGLHFDWSYWAAVPVGPVVAMLVALIMGLACLRLTGAYVALLTLAIAEMVRQLVISDTACYVMEATRCVQFAGGSTGMTGFGTFGTRPVFRGDYAMADYYILLAALTVVLIVTYGLMRGPIGLGLRALGGNPGYAVSRGVNRFKFQMLVFGISAFFTGLAGSLHAGRVGSISPTMFSLTELLFIIGMVIVGGVGRFWGPILGAVLIMALREVTRDYGDYRVIGQGLLLAAFIVLMPGGLLGLPRQIRGWLRR